MTVAGGFAAPRHGAAAVLVEPPVGIPGPDREGRIARVEQDQVSRADRGRPEPLAPTPSPGRSPSKEERDVRPHRERHLGEQPSIPDPPGASQAADHGRRVGAPTPQAGHHRDALPDPDVDPVPPPEPRSQDLGGACRQVSGTVEVGAARAAAGHRSGRVAGRDPDLVGEVEGDHQGDEVVEAVGSRRTDAEDQVHLGGRRGAEANHAPSL
jgi:hypothetical protein